MYCTSGPVMQHAAKLLPLLQHAMSASGRHWTAQSRPANVLSCRPALFAWLKAAANDKAFAQILRCSLGSKPLRMTKPSLRF